MATDPAASASPTQVPRPRRLDTELLIDRTDDNASGDPPTQIKVYGTRPVNDPDSHIVVLVPVGNPDAQQQADAVEDSAVNLTWYCTFNLAAGAAYADPHVVVTVLVDG